MNRLPVLVAASLTTMRDLAPEPEACEHAALVICGRSNGDARYLLEMAGLVLAKGQKPAPRAAAQAERLRAVPRARIKRARK